ncbi:MAG: transporter substrate-binding domain-containing protein [Faecalibacterium sp.]|nr:transporter substrate-binding domain-containing protein [Ruminococcus sp.]MCM1391203.1 transporter substrate-binding domain-containing protein [Ruminococcus sp.]MCM1485669.1 transporter substrate-binding domain-containing protein [Faecalibacterium sp.]
MNKKILAAVLAVLMVVMCFAFYGCGGNDDVQNNATSDDAATTTADAAATVADLDYIKEKGKLIVGMTIFEPMNYKDDSGNWTGFDTEFAQKFGEKLGVEVEFKPISWTNKFMELNSKSVDCLWNGMTITEDVQKNASASKAYAINGQVVVMAKDKLDEYATKESIADLKFVVEAGSAGEDELKALDIKNYTAVDGQQEALLEVKSGSADACVIDKTMADAMTAEGADCADLGYTVVLSTEEYGIGFRQGSDMVAEINATIDEFMADGTLKALAEKYHVTLAE